MVQGYGNAVVLRQGRRRVVVKTKGCRRAVVMLCRRGNPVVSICKRKDKWISKSRLDKTEVRPSNANHVSVLQEKCTPISSFEAELQIQQESRQIYCRHVSVVMSILYTPYFAYGVLDPVHLWEPALLLLRSVVGVVLVLRSKPFNEDR
jgi:hypothetical protein